MACPRDNWRFGRINGPGDHLFVECPKILDRSASAADDDRINPITVQSLNSSHDRICCSVALDLCRIQHELYIWIPPLCNTHDIVDGGSCLRRHDADGFRILGNGLFLFVIK